MGLLDGLLGQLAGNAEVANLAAKVGLTQEQLQMALQALGQAHPAPGDTVTTAAAQSGLSPVILSQIVGHLGGENALGPLAAMLGQQGGAEGGLAGGLGGLAGSFFGKR